AFFFAISRLQRSIALDRKFGDRLLENASDGKTCVQERAAWRGLSDPDTDRFKTDFESKIKPFELLRAQKSA
ncbi:MAG: hypothetical protein ABW061_17195, partial [Polyangiaceae bacterium]